MYKYGYRTILLTLVIEVIVLALMIILKGFWQFSIVMILTDIVLFGIVSIDPKGIKFYSLNMLFSEKYSFRIEEIIEFRIEGGLGLTPGRLDFKIIQNDDKVISGFMLMFSFERRKFKRRLEQAGIFVNTTV